MTFEAAVESLDARLRGVRDQAGVPGIAWGVVRDGGLAHERGLGTLRDGEAATPDGASVFRIASMTKSFTAAAVLLLRDEGRLRLDDEVAAHVPQLAGWRGPTADSPPVTIRQLLTMTAGLPTDDPWGDRQQGLPLDRFEALLAAGPTRVWPPGVVFDYSNLGYAILGRVVASASGVEYADLVRDRLLDPLGMTSTVYREEDAEPAHLAHGYARQGDRLVREGTDAYGTFAPMGGLFSSVRDLARWVAGFIDAYPARDDAEGTHPLRRSSRREMQRLQVGWAMELDEHEAHLAPDAEANGYGLGLFVVSDADVGTIVWHSGGYPGFGSVMAWHPATGVGVIALGNLRYAPVRPAVLTELRELVRATDLRPRRPRPLPAVEALGPVVEGLLATWDDAVADAVFAMNMDLDEPRAMRRATVERIRAELGPFRPDPSRPVESWSPADRTWWLRGEHGRVSLSILVTPEPEPRLQRLTVTAVPHPAPALVDAARLLLLETSRPDGWRWPGPLARAPGLDVGRVERAMRAAVARLGPLAPRDAIAGDGVSSGSFEVVAAAPDPVAGADDDPGRAASDRHAAGTVLDPAPAVLRLTLDPEGAVSEASIRFASRAAPPEGW